MKQNNIFEELMPRVAFPRQKPVRLFEAFAGVGMQRMALNRLKLPYVSVGVSEIDKYALKAYEAIHGLFTNYGDITKMTEIPPCDIFTYSFPCTDLSKAGKQKGLNGTRSGLVYEVLRLLKVSEKPQVLIMENVIDLVQVNFKKAFDEICLELEALNYTNYWQVLNAKDYGVAQNRERVFMVSILGEYYYEFPQPFPLKKRLKDYLEKVVDEKYYLSQKMVDFFQKNNIDNAEKGNGFKFSPTDGEEPSKAITTRAGGRPDDNFIQEPVSLQQVAQLGTNGIHESAGRIYNADGLCPTINTCGGGNLEPKIIVQGNYMPSGKGNANILDGNGISQAVMENHGTVQAVVEPYLIDPQGRLNKECHPLDNRPTLRAQTHGNPPQVVEPFILIPEATKTGYAEAFDGDGVYLNRPEQKRGVVQNGMIQTLKTSGEDVGVVDNYRIRKLTPLECWRLMGISDSDFRKAEKVVSASQLYKQAGNGIVVNVFALILKNLFEEPKEESEPPVMKY